VNSEQLNALKQLVYGVINSPTKKEAQSELKRLEHKIYSLNGEIRANQYNKLVETMNYSKQASAQSQDKEHWISIAKQSWTFFESLIKNDIED